MFVEVFSVITSEDCLREKWFNFGLQLGLTPGQLHNIETKYYESLQCTREVLLLWRLNNFDKPLDPLVDALCKIGLINIAVHIKYHFINPEQQSQEELYRVYHHLYDKYHVISSHIVSSGKSLKKVNNHYLFLLFLVNGGPSEIFQVHSASLCNAIEADPLRIVNTLIAKKLLASHVRKDVTSMYGTAYDKASKIVEKLQRKLDIDEKSYHILTQICDVLQEQEDKPLSNIGDKMKKLLTQHCIKAYDHKLVKYITSEIYLCFLSYSTYKQNTLLLTRSKQQPLEESDGMYCSLCSKYHGVSSQAMLPDKDIFKFSNLSYKNNIEKNTYLHVESFYACVCVTFCNFHIGHYYGKRPSSEVPLKV